jgi:hypothetical protein
MSTTSDPAVEPALLRASVREKYREVALHPGGKFHFHTGRHLAARLGYDGDVVASMPDRAVESFAGVANPFSLRPISRGDRVVEVGSGGGFDSFVAAQLVGHRRRHDCSGWATSSSARVWQKSSRSRTAGPTS